MPAPKNNQYYLLAKNFKKPKKYRPIRLWEIFLQYCEWVEKNPLKETKAFGTGKKLTVPLMRAMSIQGFCIYANMDRSTWYEYKSNEEYSYIINRIDDMMFSQKFEGASSGLLKENIIARELGLKDGQEMDVTTKQKVIILPDNNRNIKEDE